MARARWRVADRVQPHRHAFYLRADAARREAEQRFGAVRSLANYMLGDLNASRKLMPGSTPPCAASWWSAAALFDVMRDGRRQPELQREVAVGPGAWLRSSGGWAVPNTGERCRPRAPPSKARYPPVAALVAKHAERWSGGATWRVQAAPGRLLRRRRQRFAQAATRRRKPKSTRARRCSRSAAGASHATGEP